MIASDIRAAIAVEYRRGDPIKVIAFRHKVSKSSICAIARTAGAPLRFAGAGRRGGMIPASVVPARSRNAKDRLKRIKLMRLTMSRTGRRADRDLVKEVWS